MQKISLGSKLNQKIGHYDMIAGIYDKFDTHYEKQIYSKMRAKYITEITNSTILEVGVGTGKNLQYYNRENKQIIAIDKSLGMIQQAIKKLNTLHPSLRRVIKLKIVPINWNLKKNNFSHIVATFVLCTNDDPTELISKIYNALDENGKLVLFEWIPTRKGIRGLSLRVINPILHYFLGVSAYRKESLKYFQKTKWKLIKKEYFGQENIAVILTKRPLYE